MKKIIAVILSMVVVMVCGVAIGEAPMPDQRIWQRIPFDKFHDDGVITDETYDAIMEYTRGLDEIELPGFDGNAIPPEKPENSGIPSPDLKNMQFDEVKDDVFFMKHFILTMCEQGIITEDEMNAMIEALPEMPEEEPDGTIHG